jgi:hypothetical protein
MDDNDTVTYGYLNTAGIHVYNSNTYPGSGSGTITKVEVRFYGYNSGGTSFYNSVEFQPGFTDTAFFNLTSYVGSPASVGFGRYADSPYIDKALRYDFHDIAFNTTPQWSAWIDITNDVNAPAAWAWGDISNLLARLSQIDPGYTVRIYGNEIRVTYH